MPSFTPRKKKPNAVTRCMGNKQNKLELLIHEGKYDLIGITETLWDDSHDWNIAIEGYNLFKITEEIEREAELLYMLKILIPALKYRWMSLGTPFRESGLK